MPQTLERMPAFLAETNYFLLPERGADVIGIYSFVSFYIIST
jgi:hypothetical protein